MNDFSPRTRQETERQIVRRQTDFSAGVYNDIPASVIPDNGIAYLENFINKGTELVGRTGSKKWGDYATGVTHAPLPNSSTGYIYTSSVTEGVRTVVLSSGTVTSEVVGSFFVHSSGLNERIINYISSTSFTTDANGITSLSGTGSIREQVNGLYFHRFLKKIVLVIGTEVYVSHDAAISVWDKAYCESFDTLRNEICTLDEKDNSVLIGNTSGIYKLNLDIATNDSYYYYKLNSTIPAEPLYSPDAPDGAEYIRRYIYSLSKIGISNTNDTRISTGAILKTDSGTNKRDSYNIDYSEHWTTAAIDVDNGHNVRGFELPSIDESLNKEQHWTHYSIWATTDCGINGTDPVIGTATNTEQYIWVDDIPIMKSYVCSVSGNTISVTRGTVSKKDISSYISVFNGSTIEDFYITDADESFNTYTTLTSGIISSNIATLGSQKISELLYTSATDTYTITNGNLIDTTDVGKTMMLDTGDLLYISEYIDSSHFKSAGVAKLNNGDTAAASWIPTTRGYHDTISDDVLRGRIAGFPCYQRFFDKIPDTTNVICFSNGFLFAAERNKNYIYYSQVPDGFDYLMGYYHPAYQLTHIKDGIRAIRQLLDRIVIYGYNSTNVIAANTYSSVTYEDLGVYIAVLTTSTTVDENIGCVSYGSIQSLENGNHILITNEPALRIFNGQKYSENLASKKMMNILKSLQSNTSSIYSSLTGYLIWGLDE